MLMRRYPAPFIFLLGLLASPISAYAFFSTNHQLLVALQLRETREAIQMINQSPPCSSFWARPWETLRGNRSALEVTDKDGSTPLMLAAEQNFTSVITALIAKGVSVNQRDDFGNTALIRAVLLGQVNAVENLIKHGANLDLENEAEERALSIAIQNLDRPKMLKIATLLIKSGASFNFKIHDLKFEYWIVDHRGHDRNLSSALAKRGISISHPKKPLFNQASPIGPDLEKSLVENYLNQGDIAQLGRVSKDLLSHTRKLVLKKTQLGPTLSSFGQRACVIRKDQRLVCWGEKFDDPDLGAIHTPYGLGPVKSISVGPSHACAIKVTDQLVCWGSFEPLIDAEGDRAVSASVPKEHALGSFQSVTTSQNNTCAIRLGGELVCWGKKNTTPKISPCLPPPDLGLVQSISLSANKACAVKVDTGEVVYWELQATEDALAAGAVPLSIRYSATPAQSAFLLDVDIVCLIQNESHLLKCFRVSLPLNELEELPVPAEIGPVRDIQSTEFEACATTLESSHLKCWEWVPGNGKIQTMLKFEFPHDLGPIKFLAALKSPGISLFDPFNRCALLKDGTIRCWTSWWPYHRPSFLNPASHEPLNNNFWNNFGTPPQSKSLLKGWRL